MTHMGVGGGQAGRVWITLEMNWVTHAGAGDMRGYTFSRRTNIHHIICIFIYRASKVMNKTFSSEDIVRLQTTKKHLSVDQKCVCETYFC